MGTERPGGPINGTAPLLKVVSPILAGPMSPLVINPQAPRPKPAIYPCGGGPKFGFLNTIYLKINITIIPTVLATNKSNWKSKQHNAIRLIAEGSSVSKQQTEDQYLAKEHVP